MTKEGDKMRKGKRKSGRMMIKEEMIKRCKQEQNQGRRGNENKKIQRRKAERRKKMIEERDEGEE